MVLSDSRPPRELLLPPGGIEPLARDMTVITAADVPLRALQEELAQIGQWLPIDGDPASPVGSLVEQNSTGPLRLGYGAWRDILLGVQFTNGRGALISAGGRTVKNVAGYDLTKFIVGSRGVFGKIATLTVRTYRRPDGAILVRFDPDGALVARLMTTPLRPQWAILTPTALWCGYLGDRSHLDFYRSRVTELGPREVIECGPQDEFERRAQLWRREGSASFRASVPPARIVDFVAAAKMGQWVADPAFGVVLGAVDSDEQFRLVHEAAGAVGGRIITFGNKSNETQASDALASFALSTSLAERQIIERFKQAFDPDNRLTPLPWQQH